MGTYSQFKDGYKKEATFGATNTIDAATQTYLWGAVSDQSEHPSPTATVNYRATGVNAKEVPTADDLWKAPYDLRGWYGLRMQDGVVIWAALGKSATVGAVHTITPTTDGTLLPSFCFQHERTGTATAWRTQFRGCKIDRLMLSHDMRRADFLMAKVDWVAQKDVKMGFALTNDPVLPATANTAPYVQLTRTFNTVSMDGLVSVDIIIENGLSAVFSHSWDTGVYTGMWPQSFVEAQRKDYTVRMTLHPSTIETTVWDELVATGNTHDAVFTWTRSANDHIAVTCSDCQVVKHTLRTPRVTEDLLDEVVLRPRAVSVSVKDLLAASAYGE